MGTHSIRGRAIIFIDPHFGPENPRYCRPLIGFLQAAQYCRTIKLERVEYHLKEKSTADFFEKECAKLANNLPAGLEIWFRRWRELPGSEGPGKNRLPQFCNWIDCDKPWFQIGFSVKSFFQFTHGQLTQGYSRFIGFLHFPYHRMNPFVRHTPSQTQGFLNRIQ